MWYTKIKPPKIAGRVFAIENYSDGRGIDGELNHVSLHRFVLDKKTTTLLTKYRL